MVINIIDYYRPNITNGITTYINILTEKILSDGKDTLNIIYVAAGSKYKNITVESDYGFDNIYIPFDLATNGACSFNDEIFCNYLAERYLGKEIVLHFNWMNHAVIGLLFKKKRMKVRIILTKHCVAWRDFIKEDYETFFTIHNYLLKDKRSNFLLQRILHRENLYFHSVDGIIALTNDAYNLLIQCYNIDKNNIRMIYNAKHNNKKEKQCQKEYLRNKYGFSIKEKLLLYVGRISNLKGVQILAKLLLILYNKNANIRLIICGIGDFDWFLSNVSPEMKSHITFMGNSDTKTLNDMHEICDLAIMPSIVEQCSFVAIEYINARIPLLASSIPGVTELLPEEYRLDFPIEFRQSGYYVYLDKIADIAMNILNNQTISAERTEKCYKYLQKNSSVNNMLNATLAFYKQKKESLSHNTEPLVSIIIPCYNASKYLNECILSILSQTYKNYEIIIVDDGSNSIDQIIKEVNNEKITIVKNLHNKGIAYSLNKGIDAANGEFIARIDADDKMLPNRLSKQITYLQQHPECSIVGGNHLVVNAKGYPIGLTAYPETDEEIKICRFFMNPMSHPTVTMRRNIFHNHKYSSKYQHCEDYELWMQLADQYKMHNIQDCVTEYRIHDDSVSSKNQKTQKENSLQLVLDELSRIHISINDLELKIIAGCILGATRTFWSKNQKELDNLIKKILQYSNSTQDSSYLALLSYSIRHQLL